MIIILNFFPNGLIRFAAKMRRVYSVLFYLMLLRKLANLQGEKAVSDQISTRRVMRNGDCQIHLPGTSLELDQHWCRMAKFTDTIKPPGCESRNVTNRICYGYCLSIFIPSICEGFVSCGSCMPGSFREKRIVFYCPYRSPRKRIVKKVKIITSCNCQVCGETFSGKH